MKLSQTQLRALRLLSVGPLSEEQLRAERIGWNVTVHGLRLKGLVMDGWTPEGRVASITKAGLNELYFTGDTNGVG